jgi:alpha/beta superfamily hydrolase
MANDFPCGTTLTLPGPAGALEALVECAPAAAHGLADEPAPVAVICHPHPLYGGSLRNKVVHVLARVLREAAGADTLRFNFRGVGRSEGHFDHGRGETEDLLAVVRWLAAQRPAAARPLWLAGFSFGAYIALQASATLAPARLVTVAPPVTLYPALGSLRRPTCPWLVIQGERDEIVPAEAVAAWARHFEPPADLVLVPQADHFFHRRLDALAAAVRDWLGVRRRAAAAEGGGATV